MRALLFGHAVLLSGCDQAPSSSPALAGTVERSAVERGAESFADPELADHPFNAFACATCHETSARLAAGGAIRPGAPLGGVTSRPTYWGGAEIELLRAVNHCLDRFMLADELWTGTEPMAQDLYAFLESLPGPSDPVPFTIVVDSVELSPGDAARGAAVYLRACAVCHGDAPTGAKKSVDFAPVLPGDFLAGHPLGEYTEVERRLVLQEKIRHGSFLGYDGVMPPFSREVLSDEAVADLIAFFGL